MTKDERNAFAESYTEDKLDKAANGSLEDFASLKDLPSLEAILNDLINVKVAGFRGVVATSIVGLAIDPGFDPLNKFYDCNPRSIFEQGIVNAFQSRCIPSGKSDPLNVAKNVNQLDEGWISGKRPEKSARGAVNYLTEIMSADSTRRELLIDLFYLKLVEYANARASIKVEVPDREQLSNQEFSHICNRLILEYPESGTVPQYMIFKLLESVYQNSTISVEGGLESVFGTNTTSKKPADIWLEENGEPINLFEITVKKVDFKRLNDCFDSLATLKLLHLPVQFICRLPADVSDLGELRNNGASAQGKLFDFQDISEFVRSLVTLLSEKQIGFILDDIDAFMKETRRPVKTKEGWNTILGELSG